jgi:hypothetical protein
LTPILHPPIDESRTKALNAAYSEAMGVAYRGLELQRALVKRTEIFRGVQAVFARSGLRGFEQLEGFAAAARARR